MRQCRFCAAPLVGGRVDRGFCDPQCRSRYRHDRVRGGPSPHPLRRHPRGMSLEDRFWTDVETSEGCWIWLGAPTAGGYGSFHLEGRQYYAHRVSYVLNVGDIPDGLHLDHLCRNKRCVNPAHLEPVTFQENIRRGRVALAS